MPPVRKGSKSAEDIAAANKIKPMKTVRTHEENQERAYVAASRRSDRSLEARIESARRASEIHKKRTGRAFRITEEDVLNEQYYEEVDDDIPASIRRLQMHLNGLYHWNNPRFDSYMISNYAKHHAAWIAQRYGQQGNSQYANPPIFSNSFGQATQGVGGAPIASPTAMAAGASPGFPPNFPGQASQAPTPHQRSASIATPGSGYQASDTTFLPNGNFMTEEQRRFSLPAHPPARKNARQNQAQTERIESTSTTPTGSDTASQATSQQLATSPSLLNAAAQPQMMNGQNFDNMSPTSFGPFSPSVPLNVSQIWDPASQMQGMSSFYDAGLGYQYNPNASSSKNAAENASFNQGIHQTLTGNALGLQSSTSNGGSSSSAHNMKVSSPSAQQNYDTFWSGGDNSQAGNMPSDFDGFFNFPSGVGEDQEGISFLDDFINVNDEGQVAE